MVSSMLATAVQGHLFWIASRAAGIAALLFSSAAVTAGVLIGGRSTRRIPDLRPLHEALSLATLGAIVVHGVMLLGDNFLSLGVTDIAIPFASGYERGWTGLGVLAGWMLIALGLSFYARGRIGARRWRALHRFTALAWALGVAHSIGEGTDARTTWFLIIAAATTIPAAALLAARLTPAVKETT